MKRTTRLGVVGTATAALVFSGSAAFAAVTPTPDAGTFADAILGNAAKTGASFVTSSACEEDYDGSTACPTGVATTPFGGFPTAGSTFGVLTSGSAVYADRPNDDDGTSFAYGSESAIGPQVNDEQTVRIDLGAATGSCLAFDFRFLSEEYPEFVNSGFNDAFVAQLNTNAISIDEATQTVVAPGNFAAGAGDQVSVDGAGPSAMNPGNASGTTYDGATLPLVARTPVAPGSTNTLYLTVFDQGDGILDSAVFLDNLRFEDLPAGQCKSLALDPDEGTTSVSLAAPAALTATGVTLPIACNLPPGPIGCETNVSIVANPTPVARTQTRSTAPRGDLVPTQIAAGSFSVPAGSTTNVTIPITAEGAAFLAAARALPAQLRATATAKVKKAKKLKKKAKKLLKRASLLDGKKAKRLIKKAKKLKKKAKKLIRQARVLRAQADALEAKPLGTATITFANPRNGATSVASMTIPR